MHSASLFPFFFFFNDTATTEIYTLSLHDALPICAVAYGWRQETIAESAKAISDDARELYGRLAKFTDHVDRKSTRLNSSHQIISYAVFCLKKKKRNTNRQADTGRLLR